MFWFPILYFSQSTISSLNKLVDESCFISRRASLSSLFKKSLKYLEKLRKRDRAAILVCLVKLPYFSVVASFSDESFFSLLIRKHVQIAEDEFQQFVRYAVVQDMIPSFKRYLQLGLVRRLQFCLFKESSPSQKPP